jgi:hypothetical protein
MKLPRVLVLPHVLVYTSLMPANFKNFLQPVAATMPVPLGAGTKRQVTEPHLPETWSNGRVQPNQKQTRTSNVRSHIHQPSWRIQHSTGKRKEREKERERERERERKTRPSSHHTNKRRVQTDTNHPRLCDKCEMIQPEVAHNRNTPKTVSHAARHHMSKRRGKKEQGEENRRRRKETQKTPHKQTDKQTRTLHGTVWGSPNLEPQ